MRSNCVYYRLDVLSYLQGLLEAAFKLSVTMWIIPTNCLFWRVADSGALLAKAF